MITLDEYVSGNYGCYALPETFVPIKNIKLASNTQYFNRHLALFTLKYGIDVPLNDKNGNAIPYELKIDSSVIKGTGCHYGHYIFNGKVFHSIIISKLDI